MKPASVCLPAVAFAILALAPGLAHAQNDADAALTIELNSLQPSDGGCRLSFVATNGLGADIAGVTYEMVLFDQAGLVERMSVLDFKELPAGKTRVRQFDLAGADCSGISRVLVNDAKACDGKGLEPDDCMGRLRTATKIDLPFSG